MAKHLFGVFNSANKTMSPTTYATEKEAQQGVTEGTVVVKIYFKAKPKEEAKKTLDDKITNVSSVLDALKSWSKEGDKE